MKRPVHKDAPDHLPALIGSITPGRGADMNGLSTQGLPAAFGTPAQLIMTTPTINSATTAATVEMTNT